MIHDILNIPQKEFKRIETLIKNDKAFYDIQVSKIQIILLCKIIELDKRMKKLEEHCSTPLIH
jgi:hypothetical protein